MKAREVESEKKDEKKGIALPVPGTKAASELASGAGQSENNEKIDTLSFADELKKDQTKTPENDMTLVGIITAGIIGAVVIVIIIKLKKN